MTARLFVTLTLVLGSTALGELVGEHGWRLYDDAAQAVAGAAAAWVCIAAANRRTGVQRRWRLLPRIGLGGGALMRVYWGVRGGAHPRRAAPTGADIGFLVLPVFLLFGLLNAPYTRPRPAGTSPLRDQIALLIDGVLICGSLVALAWSAIPERLMSWAGQTSAAIGAAAAYAVADLLLVTMVVLLLATRPSSRAVRQPLLLGGAAFLGFGVSDTLRLIGLSDGPLTPVRSAGYLIGCGLLAVAALSRPAPTDRPTPAGAERDWLHLLLPYVP